MDKFQIVEITERFNHAGTKATADIADIAEKLGFTRVPIRMCTTKEGRIAKLQRQVVFYKGWNECYDFITDGAVVLLQHPFHYPQLTREKTLRKLKEQKHVKFISVVHDVEELRAFRFNDYYKKEFETMIEIADVIIVHNMVMKRYFMEKKVDERKLVNLEVFDYLQNSESEMIPAFERSITIAGNLDPTKCGYIGKLGQLKTIQVNLYGPNFDRKMEDYESVRYFGSFPVEEIPSKLTSGFGLVWDGESIDGCKGLSGQYLRYNNPHKLSLYLSSGLPVVTWENAAEAEFVKKYCVGICVESLLELEEKINNLTVEGYQKIVEAVNILKLNLRTGYYTEKAIKEALGKLFIRR